MMESRSNPTPPSQSAPASILVIEDDVSLQQSLKLFLTDHGYQAHVAATISAGARLLRELRPALCLLDLNLPDGSGIDLLRLIVEEKLDVRVIVMSAMPIDRLVRGFPETTLVASITKPVCPEHLVNLVEKLAARV